MIRTLVCDDEALVRARLTTLVREVPGFMVAGEAADGAAAVAALTALRPDLVLLDIQMPELDGFGVVAAVGADRMPPVIFVTAYDAHALRAFDVHALDYVLKPVHPDRLRGALERARRQVHAHRALADAGPDAGSQTGDHASASEQPAWVGRLAALLDERRGPPAAAATLSRLAVRDGERALLLPLNQIRWIDAADDSARAHANGRTYAVRARVGELAERLPPERFVRIHRSTILNLDYAREVLPWAHGEYLVVVEGGQRLHVSRSYSARLRRLLRNET